MTVLSQQPGTAEEKASRRHLLLSGGMIAAASLPPLDGAHAADTVRAAHAGRPASSAHTSRSVTANDGAQIYVKDWGAGRPIVFGHGWPLNADVWDDQMMVVAANGFRGVAFDRRGHCRSGQTWHGNGYDTFAEDLAALMTALDLRDTVLVGHSAGAGDIARYIGRHGTWRIAGVVLVSAIPPLMLKTAANPAGVPLEAFDGIRAAVAADRAQFYRELGDGPFFGANRPGSRVSQGVRDEFWLWCMQVGLRASYEGIKAFSETDFTEDLKRFDVPTQIIHGDDDQNVPVAATARVSSRLIAKATLKIYPGAPHGLTVTHRAQFDDDLKTFVKTLT